MLTDVRLLPYTKTFPSESLRNVVEDGIVQVFTDCFAPRPPPPPRHLRLSSSGPVQPVVAGQCVGRVWRETPLNSPFAFTTDKRGSPLFFVGLTEESLYDFCPETKHCEGRMLKDKELLPHGAVYVCLFSHTQVQPLAQMLRRLSRHLPTAEQERTKT